MGTKAQVGEERANVHRNPNMNIETNLTLKAAKVPQKGGQISPPLLRVSHSTMRRLGSNSAHCAKSAAAIKHFAMQIRFLLTLQTQVA